MKFEELMDRILKRLADGLGSYIKEELREEVKKELWEESFELANEKFEIVPLEHSINNFKVIDNFLQFEEGTFYKFELLVRNTDGENELFPERCSNTNRNILIKSWYVDTKDYYEKIKHEMVTLSNITGARLYVTLDRKDNVKLVNSLLHSLSDTLTAIVIGQNPSIKKISKVLASETSKVENSSKRTKTIMFDVDTKDECVLNELKQYITDHNQIPYVLETKKGYHVFCYRKFDISSWLQCTAENHFKNTTFENPIAQKDFITSRRSYLQELVSVKENELGLVYHPMKGIE